MCPGLIAKSLLKMVNTHLSNSHKDRIELSQILQNFFQDKRKCSKNNVNESAAGSYLNKLSSL